MQGCETGAKRASLNAATSSAHSFLAFFPTCGGRRPDHGFQLHAVGIGEIDGVIIAPVILPRRIDDIHVVLFEKCAKRVHVLAASRFKGVVVESDIALAVFMLSASGIRSGNPEQRLAVAPSSHVLVLVFELEAEEAQQLLVKFLRAGEIADAKNQMIDADNASQLSDPPLA